jgi:hypothetical protein
VLNAERRAWVQLECLRWNDALVTINSADINDRDKAFFRFAVHWALHDYAAAAAEAEQLLVVDPSDADAHHNLAFAYLMQGKWAAGWEEWECVTCRCGMASPRPRRLCSVPNRAWATWCRCYAICLPSCLW